MKKSLFCIIDLIAAVIISILVFAFCDMHTSSFAVSYIFLLISVFLQLLPIFAVNQKSNIVGNISGHTLSLIYLFCQICVSILGFTALSDSNIAILAMSAVLLLIYIALLLSINAAFAKEGQVRQKEKSKILFCNQVLNRLQRCKEDANNEEIASCLDKSIDYIKYGSITTPDEAKEVEEKILVTIGEIEDMIANGKRMECKNKCKELNHLLEERKNISYIYK